VKTLPNAISQERVDCAKVELMLATEPLAERSPAGKECDVSLRVHSSSLYCLLSPPRKLSPER